MSEDTTSSWADKAWSDFQRKEARREKQERAQRWAQGNAFRQARLRSKAGAEKAVSDCLGHHS